MPKQKLADDGGLDNLTHKEPSLGPACLVVSIVMLAVLSAVCAFGSWMVFSNQSDLAVKAVEKQLIPWIESSQLADQDRTEIISRLQGLVPGLKEGKYNKDQLNRLRNLLQDNPIFLWGGVQAIERQAQTIGLTDPEVQSLIRTNQRLLRTAVDRKLGRSDLEFAIQKIAEVREDGATLEVRSDLTPDLIRGYIQRAETVLKRFEVPNEPFDKTPAQAFDMLLEYALSPPGPESSTK
jgi:hypothetical protein